MTKVILEGCYHEVKINKIDMNAIPQLKVNVTVNGEFKSFIDDETFSSSKDLSPVQAI